VGLSDVCLSVLSPWYLFIRCFRTGARLYKSFFLKSISLCWLFFTKFVTHSTLYLISEHDASVANRIGPRVGRELPAFYLSDVRVTRCIRFPVVNYFNRSLVASRPCIRYTTGTAGWRPRYQPAPFPTCLPMHVASADIGIHIRESVLLNETAVTGCTVNRWVWAKPCRKKQQMSKKKMPRANARVYRYGFEARHASDVDEFWHVVEFLIITLLHYHYLQIVLGCVSEGIYRHILEIG